MADEEHSDQHETYTVINWWGDRLERCFECTWHQLTIEPIDTLEDPRHDY